MGDERRNYMNLIDLVQTYGVKLNKVGSIYRGFCPFHSETNPSFTIYPETNTFHCFSCLKSGNWISFLRIIDPESLKKMNVNILELEVLYDKINKKKNYKNYLLLMSAKIFKKIIQKKGTRYGILLMKRFDEFIATKDIIVFDEALKIINKLKKIENEVENNENSRNI